MYETENFAKDPDTLSVLSRINMHSKLLFCYFLLGNVYADIFNDIIIDYFDHKQAPSVVGYTCNFIQDDLFMIKDLNKKHMKASISKSKDVSGIHIFARADYTRVGVFLDTRCLTTNDMHSVFLESTDYRMYDELHHWLILGHNITDILGIIDDSAFGLSTDVVIAIIDNSEGYKLYDVYNTFKERGGILNITFYGEWSTATNLTVNLTQPKYNRRTDLHGILMKVMYFQQAYKTKSQKLEDYFEDYQHATKDGRSKFGYHILQHLSEMYNFTIESSEAPKWQPGDPMGPLGAALAKGEADFTGTTLTIAKFRTYAFKFVHQDWPFRTVIIFRNPQPTEIKVRELFRPLANNVWYLMSILIIIIFLCLNFAFRFESEESRITKMSNALLVVIGVLCQQGTNMEIRLLATRIMFYSTLIFSVLIYDYYSASVVSARLDDPIFKINDSLQEFTNLKIKMKSEWIAYLEFLLNFNKKTKEFKANYWSKIPDSEKYMEPEEGMRLVRRGGFAYHMHPQVGYPFIDETFTNREICELMEVHLGVPLVTAFGVTMNSTVVEISRIGLSRISEVGLRRRQLSRWQYPKPRCRNNILNASSVNIYEFLPHMILLIIGIFIAIVIFVVEILIHRCEIDNLMRLLRGLTGLFRKCNVYPNQ